MKRQRFSRPELIPHLISSSQGNIGIFLGSLMSSHSSGRNDHPYGSSRIHMVSLFRDGSIKLVAIFSGKIFWIIKIVDALFSRISSLPSISMSFIS